MSLTKQSLLAFVIVLTPTGAHAICRVVVSTGSPPPVIDPAQSVLLVHRQNVPVGQDCGPMPPNMSMPDLGVSLADDLGIADLSWPDSGPLDDGGLCFGDDGGSCFDLGAPPPDLAPQCRDRLGDAVTMVVQPQFSTGATGSSFAMLMVTPKVPTVSLAPTTLFHDLAVATAPKVITVPQYVEDPSLGCKKNDPKWNSGSGGGCGGSLGGGGWGGPTYTPPSSTGNSDAGIPDSPTTLGGYDLAVLANADLPTVQKWLDAHQYAYQASDLDALQPYVSAGWTVTAVRVHVGSATSHSALDPLAFTFESSIMRLPIAVSRSDSMIPVPITVYVAAEERYDFSTASGHVSFAQAVSFSGGSFLTRSDLSVNFDVTADQDPIAIGNPADPVAQDSVTVTQIVKVPTTSCNQGCSCRLSGSERGVPGLLALIALPAIALALRRRRRA
jgi:hypothetical protein